MIAFLIALCMAILLISLISAHNRGVRENQELERRRAEDAKVETMAAELAKLKLENSKLQDIAPAEEAEDPNKAPWASIRSFNTNDQGAGQNILPVSRHDIAECGLFCPSCKQLVSKKGQYDRVRRTYINGQENEVVKCTGRMLFEGNHEEDCPLWLAASPDTEHGDHLKADGTLEISGENDPADFYQFKRVSAKQVLAERYGMDVTTDKAGDIILDPKTRLPVAYGNKYDSVLSGAELVRMIHAASGLKECLPEGAPSIIKDPDPTPAMPTPTLPA